MVIMKEDESSSKDSTRSSIASSASGSTSTLSQSFHSPSPSSYNTVEAENQLTSAQIQVYARIKPSSRLPPTAAVTPPLALDMYAKSLTLSLPPSSSHERDVINNQKLSHTFAFHGLIAPSSTQTEAYECLGRPCVETLFEGFNATVFAYGQTGSGKTYTVTGGVDSYESRGLIPRVITALFDRMKCEEGEGAALKFSAKVSYLEIYNDSGYDLLDRSDELVELSQLPKVTLLEDEQKRIHLQGLGEYSVSSQEDALELLFRGDTNRLICETPSNDASTRSHCIFTITLEARTPDNRIRRSKLNLVDLAGSERIKKTQVQGKLMKEASHINLSLHHLEQVIVALHERSKGKSVHVPYRNSMMTNVLRDSLGGNCRTIMVATLSGEASHVDESISTARFASRVSMIVNKVWAEEEEDVEELVKKLKYQVKDLKDEVRRLRGERGVGVGEILTEDEQRKCIHQAKNFLKLGDLQLLPLQNDAKIIACFSALRDLYLNEKSYHELASEESQAAVTHFKREEYTELMSKITQMETEVRKREACIRELNTEICQLRQPHNGRHTLPYLLTNQQQTTNPSPHATTHNAEHPTGSFDPALRGEEPGTMVSESSTAEHVESQSAFEMFRASYEENQTIETKKDKLRMLIDQAKALGEGINASREAINKHKSLLQAKRVQRELMALKKPTSEEEKEEITEDTVGERLLKASIEQDKKSYRDNFELLKIRKSEIEHLKALIERSRRVMRMDFERWKQLQDQVAPSNISSTAHDRIQTSTVLSGKEEGKEHSFFDEGTFSRLPLICVAPQLQYSDRNSSRSSIASTSSTPSNRCRV